MVKPIIGQREPWKQPGRFLAVNFSVKRLEKKRREKEGEGERVRECGREGERER